jgi:hypothetical protein
VILESCATARQVRAELCPSADEGSCSRGLKSVAERLRNLHFLQVRHDEKAKRGKQIRPQMYTDVHRLGKSRKRETETRLGAKLLGNLKLELQRGFGRQKLPGQTVKDSKTHHTEFQKMHAYGRGQKGRVRDRGHVCRCSGSGGHVNGGSPGVARTPTPSEAWGQRQHSYTCGHAAPHVPAVRANTVAARQHPPAFLFIALSIPIFEATFYAVRHYSFGNIKCLCASRVL